MRIPNSSSAFLKASKNGRPAQAVKLRGGDMRGRSVKVICARKPCEVPRSYVPNGNDFDGSAQQKRVEMTIPKVVTNTATGGQPTELQHFKHRPALAKLPLADER
jgi:hypothetical protein